MRQQGASTTPIGVLHDNSEHNSTFSAHEHLQHAVVQTALSSERRTTAIILCRLKACSGSVQSHRVYRRCHYVTCDRVALAWALLYVIGSPLERGPSVTRV